MKKYLTVAGIAFVLIVGFFYMYQYSFVDDLIERDVQVSDETDTTVVADELFDLEGANMERLSKGCIGKDCITSIDDPKFVSVEDADFLKDEEWVIGLERNGETRAYPIKILNWHEIVNDKIGDEYIGISFCPLCYTGNAFDRVIDGVPSEFGVSGYLLNSNLVMYDRNTNSLWEQLTGEALSGPQIGKKLKKITVSTLPWGDWVLEHPSTIVLSTETGHSRDYDSYPYGDYNSSRDVFFALENTDDRLFEKELIYGVLVFDKAKAYSVDKLNTDYPDGGEFEDTVGGHSVVVNYQNGRLEVKQRDSGTEIVPEIGFWFSWVAFYPETEFY